MTFFRLPFFPSFFWGVFPPKPTPCLPFVLFFWVSFFFRSSLFFFLPLSLFRQYFLLQLLDFRSLLLSPLDSIPHLNIYMYIFFLLAFIVPTLLPASFDMLTFYTH